MPRCVERHHTGVSINIKVHHRRAWRGAKCCGVDLDADPRQDRLRWAECSAHANILWRVRDHVILVDPINDPSPLCGKVSKRPSANRCSAQGEGKQGRRPVRLMAGVYQGKMLHQRFWWASTAHRTVKVEEQLLPVMPMLLVIGPGFIPGSEHLAVTTEVVLLRTCDGGG